MDTLITPRPLPISRFSVRPLHELTRGLAAVAAGRQAPDLVITNARILSTYSERFLTGREIWIWAGRIAAVQPTGSWKATGLIPVGIYDAGGAILAPGLVDPHLHVESSMMTVCAFAEAALLNGTTTIFCDSHEIANVADVPGIEWMLEDARQAPLNVFLTVPSSVPAVSPEFETAGGDLTADKVGAIFDQWPEAIGLGEKMDFVQLCAGDDRSHDLVSQALSRGRPVSGHVYGREFVAPYAASGVTDCHEADSREMAEDLLEAGLWLFLRGEPLDSMWNALPQTIQAVTEGRMGTKRICLCTDDRDPDDLFKSGLDWVVRQAVAAGISPECAWSMGSINPATRFGMDGEIGGLGGGRRADIVLLDDDLTVRNTWYGGRLVVEDGKLTAIMDRQLADGRYQYPEAAYQTVSLPDQLTLLPPLPLKVVDANVISISETMDLELMHQVIRLETADIWQSHLTAHGLCFVTVIERHGKSGTIGHGLLRGFGLRGGAVACTVSHDAHNLIVAGDNEADMAMAVEQLRIHAGGVVVVSNGQVLALVELPIAGLLSDARGDIVAEKMRRLKLEWKKLGCGLSFMGFNTIALTVIPGLRITDKGLIMAPEMKPLPLFDELIFQDAAIDEVTTRCAEGATLN